MKYRDEKIEELLSEVHTRLLKMGCGVSAGYDVTTPDGETFSLDEFSRYAPGSTALKPELPYKQKH